MSDNRTFTAIPANYSAPDVLAGDFTKHPLSASVLADGDPAARQLADAHSGLREGHAEIVGQLRRDVKTKTPERHFLDMEEAATRWRNISADRSRSAREAGEARTRTLDVEIAARCGARTTCIPTNGATACMR